MSRNEKSAARILSGDLQLGRLYVEWGYRDGLHLIGPRLHFHAYLWPRGRLHNPIYMRLSRSKLGGEPRV